MNREVGSDYVESRLAVYRLPPPSAGLRDRALDAAFAAWKAPRSAVVCALDYALALRRSLVALAASLALWAGVAAMFSSSFTGGLPPRSDGGSFYTMRDFLPEEYDGRVVGASLIPAPYSISDGWVVYSRQLREILESVTEGTPL